jgi:hypothetical protein
MPSPTDSNIIDAFTDCIAELTAVEHDAVTSARNARNAEYPPAEQIATNAEYCAWVFSFQIASYVKQYPEE